MKIIKKILKVLLIIIISFIFLYILNVLRLLIFYEYHKGEYLSGAEINGVKDHYVPQGYTYSEKYNITIQTSYNGDHKVSKLYVVDFSSNKLLKELNLNNMDGSINTHHVGGITTDDNTVFITNDYEVEEYSLDEIMNTELDSVQAIKVTKLPIRGDFCTFHNDMLWIGDFFLKPFYYVPNDNPLLLGYSYSEDINYNIPDVVISLPKMVQGLTFNDKDEFVLTASYTYLINSNFYIYKNVLKEKADETIKINDKEVPYYKFDKKFLVKKIKIPPMAEELFYKDNTYYILFESNTDNYSMALPKIKNIIKYKTDKK